MRTFAVAYLAVTLTLPSAMARATEPRTGGPLADAVAPFLDEQTVLVAHLNLAAFDLAGTLNWLAELNDMADRDRDRLLADVAMAGVVTQAFRSDKAIDVFLVVSLADMGRLPFFLVLPIDEHSPAAAIAGEARKQLERAWHRSVANERVGDAIILGSPETVARLKKGTPASRPDVAAAFGAADSGALQLAFVPPAPLRKLAETLVPELPQSLGGAPTKIFTEGAAWVATDIDLPPKKIAIRVAVQSADAESARTLESALARLVATLGQMPQIANVIPEFDKQSQRLLPKADGDQLTLDLTEDNGGIDALKTVAGPILRAVSASLEQR